MRRLVALLLLAGCGLGGAAGGGGAELPVSGVGPYRKITDFEHATDLDEPYIVNEDGIDLTEPAALELDGTIRLYYSRAGASILRVDLAPSLTKEPSDPETALAADEDWEQGGVRAPAVVQLGSKIMMFYQGAGGGIGRADSSDRGKTFSKRGRVMDGAEPSIVVTDRTWYLYRTLPGGVFVSTSVDGQTWTDHPDPILAASATAPHATGGITAAGELHVDLVYTRPSTLDGSSAIFYAGSEDGLVFESRPLSILEPAAPGELTPSLLLEGPRSLLFFAQARGVRSAIAAAKAP